eukprot:TRINITY_DN22014_c0_g1_i1.p2 TRINITY_DN22014_c0_g1~~TRINITY_DN22014_c0_g1_i1.p2  ORF type:complete len:179 (+),score=54.98 TRINITY_DN22014_c0_g1_i1:385-921(+)
MPENNKFVLGFMRSIVQLQLQLERSFTRIAAATGRPTILVCDRGVLDNKGYISPEGWEKTISFVNKRDGATVDEEYLRRRYDVVVHMTTAAEGAEKYYKWGWQTDDNGNKVYRSESPEQARELDRKMISCWEDHPCHVVVKNTKEGFNAKINTVSDVIMKVALQKHPQQQPKPEARTE